MKKNNKRLIVLISILAALILFIAAAGVKVYRDDREQRARFESGEYGEYHNQPNNIFGAPVVYYKSDLERIVGVRLREDESDIMGYECMRYWNNRVEPTIFDDLRFYVFPNGRQAAKALKKVKKNSFYEITDEGDNYVRGWVAGVMDADIENYYYVNGNLMVVTTVTSVDESARPADDTSPRVMGGGQEALDLIKLINDNF